MTPTSSHRPGADPAGSPGSGARTGFDHVYDQPDPRGYFQALGPFGYQTPHHAQRVFRRLVGALAPSNAGQRVTVLDICCSYGINAALLNHNLTLADLQARYTGPETTTLSVAELVNADRVFYAAHRHPTGQTARVIGLDPARNAIDYARAVGLVDAGFAENLETTPAHAALLAAVQDPYPDTNPSLRPVSGIGGQHRDNKSHSIDGRDQPTTQRLRETDAGLGGD
ncbi:MAG TPA: hypothetical protein VFW64_21865 [Pseudonocardiaceae bacterium]|nr:hypothetical protein [Pseudonocardiaceae bacterium]